MNINDVGENNGLDFIDKYFDNNMPYGASDKNSNQFNNNNNSKSNNSCINISNGSTSSTINGENFENNFCLNIIKSTNSITSINYSENTNNQDDFNNFIKEEDTNTVYQPYCLSMTQAIGIPHFMINGANGDSNNSSFNCNNDNDDDDDDTKLYSSFPIKPNQQTFNMFSVNQSVNAININNNINTEEYLGDGYYKYGFSSPSLSSPSLSSKSSYLLEKEEAEEEEDDDDENDENEGNSISKDVKNYETDTFIEEFDGECNNDNQDDMDSSSDGDGEVQSTREMYNTQQSPHLKNNNNNCNNINNGHANKIISISNDNSNQIKVNNRFLDHIMVDYENENVYISKEFQESIKEAADRVFKLSYETSLFTNRYIKIIQGCQKKRNKINNQFIQQWVTENIDNPYPTKEEKRMIASKSGCSISTINTYFTNLRRKKNSKCILKKENIQKIKNGTYNDSDDNHGGNQNQKRSSIKANSGGINNKINQHNNTTKKPIVKKSTSSPSSTTTTRKYNRSFSADIGFVKQK